MAWTTPDWIPFLGVVELDDEIMADCELDPRWVWKGLIFEWFGGGWLLMGWPSRLREAAP